MWQEIILLIIGIAAAVYVGYRIVRAVSKGRRPHSPCDGCGGCPAGDKK